MSGAIYQITLLLVVVANHLQLPQSFLSHRAHTHIDQRQVTATFDGFGSSTKRTDKKNKKKRRGLIIDKDLKPETTTSDPKAPELDRFGLPIRTAENFFPPLPPETELLGYERT